MEPGEGAVGAPAEPPRPRGRIQLGRIQIGTPASLGPTSSARLVALAAAAAPADSDDPVDLALLQETRAFYDERPMPPVETVSFEPATPERRYSVTRVRGLRLPDGTDVEELDVMRGDLRAVAAATRLSPDRRLLLMNNASYVGRRGYRPLAVATAPVSEDDAGRFEVHGFVPVRTARAKGFRADVSSRPAEWVRVPVWPATLRWLHWLNVVAITLLTVTGYYIANPFFDGSRGGAGFFMGWVRFVHFAVAYGWVTLGLWRLYLLFFSRNRFVRWPALWPLKSRQDVRNMGRTISAYLLVHPENAPTYIAHNPLQQLTYTGIYVLALVEVVTGFGLYGLYHTDFWLWSLLQWPVGLLGEPLVRQLHYVIMLVFWIFVVLHIYLAVRADTLERHGGLSSIISGGVWLRKGSHPVDDPNL
jgi:Ni/Fe-hydrogenase b-type cytochrome subunit